MENRTGVDVPNFAAKFELREGGRKGASGGRAGVLRIESPYRRRKHTPHNEQTGLEKRA